MCFYEDQLSLKNFFTLSQSIFFFADKRLGMVQVVFHYAITIVVTLDRQVKFLNRIFTTLLISKGSFFMKRIIFLFSCVIFWSLFSFAKGENKNEKFEKPIIRFLPAMQECRKEALKNSIVSGKIVVDYQINDKAELHKVKINEEKTTLSDLNMQKCVVDVMKKIKFPKAPKGKTVSITYPIEFK